jgi:hypothetical protein
VNYGEANRVSLCEFSSKRLCQVGHFAQIHLFSPVDVMKQLLASKGLLTHRFGDGHQFLASQAEEVIDFHT